MTNNQIITFLTLKYGTMNAAFGAWTRDPYKFTDEEDKFMTAWWHDKFPNLNLVNVGKTEID